MKNGVLTKIFGFAAIALSVGATLLSNYSSEQTMKETVAKEVAKVLNDK